MYTIDCEIKKGFDLLPWSSIEHLAGAHLRSELVMESLPVVHWHLVSVREQPEAGTAAAKQGSYSNKASVSISSNGALKLDKGRGSKRTAHVGTPLKSCADTNVAAAAARAKMEKRILLELGIRWVVWWVSIEPEEVTDGRIIEVKVKRVNWSCVSKASPRATTTICTSCSGAHHAQLSKWLAPTRGN
jgi:hypothetical protein